jgi:hypothetical protein
MVEMKANVAFDHLVIRIEPSDRQDLLAALPFIEQFQKFEVSQAGPLGTYVYFRGKMAWPDAVAMIRALEKMTGTKVEKL